MEFVVSVNPVPYSCVMYFSK